ncbi:melanophilin isoform X2 [Nerophis lumbriciformis]|uniref:melanophilin isoform X2 n=1 Tax=Nerophis lumbriciformis TaxID=546530 RepID=UPI002AE05481|nr:melanophilin-like isoform X2 [Nerophis lumbriciformis]
MLGVMAAKKLDLSKLTDEEVSHVWKVVQRDFHLRKKEEDRLGDLKSKIWKEDSKRELLCRQTCLSESYCIRCIKPFKFLVNSKRRCLDCQLFVCKACSRWNKRQRGFVCDPCHMTRVLKIGTLEWYYENVQARFKHFGSANVMRCLFKRLSGKHTCSSDEDEKLGDYDTQSNPELHTVGYEDAGMDVIDSQHYHQMKKNRRRLTVNPIDIGDLCDVKSTQSNQDQSTSEDFNVDVGSDGGLPSQQEDAVYSDQPSVASRSTSRLSCSTCGSAGVLQNRTFYTLGPDDYECDFDLRQSDAVYSSQEFKHTSQDSLNDPNPHPPQMNEMVRRMSAVEMLLNRLQVTLTFHQTSETSQVPDRASSPHEWEEVEMEEHQLRQKLNEMTGDISDRSLSCDEDEAKLQEEAAAQEHTTLTSSRSRIVVSNTQKRNSSIESLKNKSHLPDDESKSNFKGSTALLFELEDKIAQAAADVQNTQTQVSHIENRVAALNSAGLPLDNKLKSGIQTRRLSQNFPTRRNHDTKLGKRRLSLM